jgi:Phage integrase family
MGSNRPDSGSAARGTNEEQPAVGSSAKRAGTTRSAPPAAGEASAAYVFISEHKAPSTPDAVHKIVARAGREAGLEFPIHPHMLRHATGYKLANDGTTPERFNSTSGTATSNTPHAIQSWPQPVLRTFGRIGQPCHGRLWFAKILSACSWLTGRAMEGKESETCQCFCRSCFDASACSSADIRRLRSRTQRYACR